MANDWRRKLAARIGITSNDQTDSQLDLIRKLDQSGVLTPDIRQLFHSVRRSGNEATHEFRSEHKPALENLKVARQLAIWFYRTFGDPGYAAAPFVPP